MMENQLTEITSLISMLFIAILVFWLYRDYRVDAFRQGLFKIRDEFFDEAASSNISFEAPAYGMIRGGINGYIRFAHRINIFQFLMFLAIYDKKSNVNTVKFSDRFEDAIKNLPNSEKDIYKTYYIKMNFLLIEHLVISSPFLMLTLVAPIFFFIAIKNHVKETITIFKTQLDKIEIAALAIA